MDILFYLGQYYMCMYIYIYIFSLMSLFKTLGIFQVTKQSSPGAYVFIERDKRSI